MRDLKKLENELRFAADAGCDYTLLLEAADALAEARKCIEEQKAGTIYVVTAGEYSDYGIVGVTLDYAKAKEECRRYKKIEPSAAIEEHTDLILYKTLGLYEVIIKNGQIVNTFQRGERKRPKAEIVSLYRTDDYFRGRPDGNTWIVNVFAENEEKARKIAKDAAMKKEAEAQDL